MTQLLRPHVHLDTEFLYDGVTEDDDKDDKDGVKMSLMKTSLNNSRKPVMMAQPESENNGDNEIIFTTISCQCQSQGSQKSETRSRGPRLHYWLVSQAGEYHDNTEIITQIIRHNCTITLHL